MKKNKVFSLVWGLISLVLSGFMIYVCFGLNSELNTTEGLARLSLIVLIPVMIVIYLITISLSISSLLSSVKIIKVDNQGFKITGIVMLVLSILASGCWVWAIVNLFVLI